MKVFVTGGTNLLGGALLNIAPKTVKLAASYNKNTLVPNVDCKYYLVDVTKKDQIELALNDFHPDIVIHAAALSSPDFCDKHQDLAWLVNVEGTRNIIEACKKHKASLVYISTNGIYDGKKAPYKEESKAMPVDTYGKTKLAGEKLAKKSNIPTIIVRLMTMYGWSNPSERQNPATWLIEMVGKNKSSINVVTDLYNNFLYAEDGARAIWKAIRLKKYGESFNVAGEELVSRYEFLKQAAKIFKLDHTKINPVTSDFFNNLVKRPKNTHFDITKMKEILGVKPKNIRKGLTHMKLHPLNKKFWKRLS